MAERGRRLGSPVGWPGTLILAALGAAALAAKASASPRQSDVALLVSPSQSRAAAGARRINTAQVETAQSAQKHAVESAPAPWGSLEAAPSTGGAGRGEPARSEPPLPLPSPAGQALLMRPTTLRADYGPLSEWLETQANLAYCGVASSVVALNSLALPAPAAEGYGPYRFWTQVNLFEAAAGRRFAQPALVARQGMTLEQLQGLLLGQGARVERHHGDRLSLGQFRALLRRSLADAGDRLLVNYQRSALGQSGGGHISPLAAYDPSTERVLILDVARYRYPAVWVGSADLWRAVRTIDAASGRSRGLLLIRPPAQPPGTASRRDPS